MNDGDDGVLRALEKKALRAERKKQKKEERGAGGDSRKSGLGLHLKKPPREKKSRKEKSSNLDGQETEAGPSRKYNPCAPAGETEESSAQLEAHTKSARSLDPISRMLVQKGQLAESYKLDKLELGETRPGALKDSPGFFDAAEVLDQVEPMLEANLREHNYRAGTGAKGNRDEESSSEDDGPRDGTAAQVAVARTAALALEILRTRGAEAAQQKQKQIRGAKE
eukprot:g3956.t1